MINSMVSIIVPVYNTEKYLERCIESILEQTYTNLELIIINDGSNGSEEAIIYKYMGSDKRIKYIKHEINQGLFKSRIHGVEAADGEYVAFVDSDDYIGIDFLRLLIEQMIESAADISYTSTVCVTDQGKLIVNNMQEIALNVLPLEGDNIKKQFFGQSGSAYVWHTVWNKMYRKELWDKSLPYLKKLDKHLVMTEDIAFSTVLLYFAEKVTKAENSIYYYCQNADSSTNTRNMSFNAYNKKISDITSVFDFADDFLESQGADEWIKLKFNEFRQYYARMWKRGIINILEDEKKEMASELVDRLCANPKDEKPSDDGYFNMSQVPFSNQLEKIKREILKASQKYISFDIFDTVVSRPFYNPTDLFYLLDKEYEKHQSSNLSFHLIRLEGELGARQAGKEDITLKDIYSYIERTYFIDKDVCTVLMEEEKKLEESFSQVRKTVREIYDIAKLTGKPIIFISDMYLDIKTIEKILKKNGYSDYVRIFLSSECGKLKATGKLFEYVLEELNIPGNELLHIGDNYKNDIEKAEKYGIRTLYIPKAMDVFENKVENIKTNNCASIGKRVGGFVRDGKGFEKISGYGTLTAVAANKYFDNPFRLFHPMSDFNIDPYFVGYYALGMTLIGMIRWIEQLREQRHFQKIDFMARDGYLIKRAYDMYLGIMQKNVETDYIYASRKSMLPMILAHKIDFMNLPIVYEKYTPVMIMELLGFCVKPITESELKSLYNNYNIKKDIRFKSIAEYHRFIKIFLENIYDENRHSEAKDTIKGYLGDIESDDFIFDMGYSASIHNAVVGAIHKTPAAVFVHSDRDKHFVLSRRGQFEIDCLFDFIPNISGLLREYFFSDPCGSCIGYKKAGDKIIPILEDDEKSYSDKFPIMQMQNGALQFCQDFITRFQDYWDYIDIRTQDVVLPFEGFMRMPTKIDTKMFSASYFEDKVYGALSKMNVREFWLTVLSGMTGCNIPDITRDFNAFMNEKNKRKLALFGTGNMCRDILDKYQLPVDIFIDNDFDKKGKLINGVEIINPQDIKDWSNYYVAIVCGAYLEIEEQLENLGLVKFVDFASFLDLF